MRPAWFTAIACLLIGTVSACRAPEVATEIVVLVRSDLEVPADIDRLRIRVFDSSGEAARKEQTVDLAKLAKASKGSPFPLSFSLSSPASTPTAFRLVVTGLKMEGGAAGSADVVEAQARASFEPNRRLFMQVELMRSCLAMLCRDGNALTDRTCAMGTCVAVPTAPLSPDEPVDRGTDVGGAMTDAGDGGADRDAGGEPDADREPGPACESSTQCERLVEGAEPEGCAVAVCEDGACIVRADDADKDGHATARCSVPGAEVALGDDCDDAAKERHPGAWDGPEVDGEADACDARDNDCDGEVDEDARDGKSCTCDPAEDVAVDCSERADGTPIMWPKGAPAGNCEYGKRSCEAGAWTACRGAVEPEEQDSCTVGDDADCDGLPNEGCDCQDDAMQPCGVSEGDCEPGMQTCRDGEWSACEGAIGPLGPDTCEPGSDRDCDGMPNEGCECVSGTRTTCGEALDAQGDCAARSVECVRGRWMKQQCAPTSEELCADDGRDENCDGAVNERRVCACTNGARSSCLVLGLFGVCSSRGRTSCSNGSWGPCDVSPARRDTCEEPSFITGAGDENCNGIYNQGCCQNGETESCGGSGCMGTRTCVGREWGGCVCQSPPGQQELQLTP